MIHPEPARSPPRSFLLVAVALGLAAAAGGVGYLLGWMGGQAAVQQATLRIAVENRSTSPLEATLLINGKVRQTLSIAAGATATTDQGVTFASADGAYFQVEVVAGQGPRDAEFVYVPGAGIYPVALRLG